MNLEENSIFSLCDDLLYIILTNIGKHRKSACLTCKRFYKLCCEIEKFKSSFIIDNEKLENKETYNSMINSERKFDKMIINANRIETIKNLYELKTICFYKTANITELVFDSCRFLKTDVILLLNSFENLSSLKCFSWKLENEFFDEPQEILQINLKELKISKCDQATVDFFIEYLLENILDKLTIDVDPGDLLLKQKEIVELDVTSESLSEFKLNDLTHLTLMLRKYQRNNQSILQEIIENHPALTYLNLLKCEGVFDNDDNSFKSICSLNNLKILKFNIDELSLNVFRGNFSKLENLNQLEVESTEHNYSTLVDTIESLSFMKFSQLHYLRIDVDFINVPLDRIERMGNNLSKLESLIFKCECPLPLDIYFKSFKLLKFISIDYHYNRNFAKLCNDYETQFPDLKHLVLKGFLFGSDDLNWNELNLLKLTKMLPNLETLDIEINFQFSLKLIFKIIERLPKLKSIKNFYMIQSGENYDKFDWNSISTLQDISNNLKHFSIELKLKSISMDVSLMKEDLGNVFKFDIRKYGTFTCINLSK